LDPFFLSSLVFLCRRRKYERTQMAVRTGIKQMH
jgi:hypothetical protein